MSNFPENDRAQIEIKKIMLKALQERKTELDPITVYLGIEIDVLKRDIKKLEDEVRL